jgi:hypothetical protein
MVPKARLALLVTERPRMMVAVPEPEAEAVLWAKAGTARTVRASAAVAPTSIFICLSVSNLQTWKFPAHPAAPAPRGS